jgi:ATP-dependent DNA ligase
MTTTTTRDVPMGWATDVAPYLATVAPEYDTAPRLVRGASAAAELVSLCGVWSPEAHPADATAEPKIDGHRSLFLGGAYGAERILSREGAAQGMAAHCLPALRQLQDRFGEAMMFDGEFTVPGGLKETLRAHRRNKPALTGTLWLFDAVPLREWQKGGTDQPLADRKARLATAFGEGVCRSVGRLLDHRMDAEQALVLARGMWRSGFEGIVVKDRAAGYVRGRSNNFLKLKQGN